MFVDYHTEYLTQLAEDSATLPTQWNELPRSKLRDIGETRQQDYAPHQRIKYGAGSALAREQRGNKVTPQRGR